MVEMDGRRVVAEHLALMRKKEIMIIEQMGKIMGRLKTCIYVKERRMNGGRTLETGNEACEFHIKKKTRKREINSIKRNTELGKRRESEKARIPASKT